LAARLHPDPLGELDPLALIRGREGRGRKGLGIGRGKRKEWKYVKG